jgi:ribosomal protein S18 acetylase RimI-like enzyme
MLSNPPELVELAWDTEQLGYRCGIIRFSKIDVASIDTVYKDFERLLYTAFRDGYWFITAKVPAEWQAVCHACQMSGGILADSEMTFHKNKWITDRQTSVEGVTVEKHTTFWDDSFLAIPDTLQYSRFFSDRNIGADPARKLWTQSIINSCNGRASYSIIGLFDGRPAGLINVFEKDGVSNIFLIAVIPQFQGRGIGKSMVSYYEHSLDNSVIEQIVETQMVNYGAQKLYTSFGYTHVFAKHVFHFWSDRLKKL